MTSGLTIAGLGAGLLRGQVHRAKSLRPPTQRIIQLPDTAPIQVGALTGDSLQIIETALQSRALRHPPAQYGTRAGRSSA